MYSRISYSTGGEGGQPEHLVLETRREHGAPRLHLLAISAPVRSARYEMRIRKTGPLSG